MCLQASGIFFDLETNPMTHLRIVFCSGWIMAATVILIFSPLIAAEPNLVGKVVEVIDGDSVTIIDADSKLRRVRLSGIDAPEKGQQFSQRSRRHLMELTYGKLVSAACPKVDRYRREVCTVWVDGQDVSLALLNAGLVWHFKRYAHEQPETDRETYAKAEDAARVRRLGLWQEEHPLAPWEWRQTTRGPRTVQP
jgi:endonuclease YncB( thermonuclease family)